MIVKNWWKEVIIYQIYPRSFQDSNGDGIGDIPGIISRIPYLADLGVDVIWICPVYDSPNDDNGYDIRDYYKISELFGTMEDMELLIETVHKHGMKLLMDMVVNHTSDEHEWFKNSKSSKDNQYRDFYFWRDEPNNWKSFFSGSCWEPDIDTDQYYLHLFSKKQPDLNWENPTVVEEIYKIFRFWLEKGIDGFRLDVISLISKRLDFPQIPSGMSWTDVIDKIYANGPRVHEFIQDLNKKVFNAYPSMMTVGEGAGITIDIANDYVGAERKEINMIFQLEHMTNNYGPDGRFDYREESLPEIKYLFKKWDAVIEKNGWVNVFLDNHDFIRMQSRYGDPQHHEKSSKLLLTLLLSLRGTPCIYFGSEIGMTNITLDSLDEVNDVESINYMKEAKSKGVSDEEILQRINHNGRDNARTPMQWNSENNAGFSSGEPWLRVNPNYKEINVKNQQNDPDSILQYFKELVLYRKANNIFVYGDYHDLDPDHSDIFIYRRSSDQTEKLVILNFSNKEVSYPYSVMDYEIEINNYISLRFDQDMFWLQPWQAVILSK